MFTVSLEAASEASNRGCLSGSQKAADHDELRVV
jgi:hypothetical protein